MERIDISTSGWHDEVTVHLADRGIAMTTGIETIEAFTGAAREYMSIRLAPPITDSNGISIITRKNDQSPDGEHTSHNLEPHTDGAAGAEPPHLIFLSCLAQASEGGESNFWDGRAIYKELSRDYPAALKALMHVGGVNFNGLHKGAIFEPAGSGRIRIRILFGLSEYSPETIDAISILKQIIDDHTYTVRLNPGDGYIVDNSRWAHGRNAFTGGRIMLRAVGDPLADVDLPLGFSIP